MWLKSIYRAFGGDGHGCAVWTSHREVELEARLEDAGEETVNAGPPEGGLGENRGKLQQRPVHVWCWYSFINLRQTWVLYFGNEPADKEWWRIPNGAGMAEEQDPDPVGGGAGGGWLRGSGELTADPPGSHTALYPPGNPSPAHHGLSDFGRKSVSSPGPSCQPVINADLVGKVFGTYVKIHSLTWISPKKSGA